MKLLEPTLDRAEYDVLPHASLFPRPGEPTKPYVTSADFRPHLVVEDIYFFRALMLWDQSSIRFQSLSDAVHDLIGSPHGRFISLKLKLQRSNIVYG